jgi:hypothetical protein
MPLARGLAMPFVFRGRIGVNERRAATPRRFASKCKGRQPPYPMAGQMSLASSVISALRTLETGQFFSAS